MRKTHGSSQRRIGPARPDPVRPGVAGQPCQIQFGHNVSVKRVLMRFSVSTDELMFTPEEADDVAMKLQHYAKAARGEKVA